MLTMNPDVLVCGGGCAGLVAALAAARNGATTLLVERAGFAGGIITTVGLPYFDGIAAKGQGWRVVIRGIPLELMTAMEVCPADVEVLPKLKQTIDNVERFKLLADRLLLEQGDRLQVLFHSLACGVRLDGDEIAEVQVANKAGLVSIRPRTVIDCTGDGDMAAWAGAPWEKNEPLQPLTMHFRIGNVRRHPDLESRCQEELIKAHDEGELRFFYGPWLKFLFAPNEAYIHAIRVAADATDPLELTAAE